MNSNEEELEADDFQVDELVEQFRESSERLHEWNELNDLERLRTYKRLVERNTGHWNNKKICGFTFCPFPHYNEHKLSLSSDADVKEEKTSIVVPTKLNSQKIHVKKDGSNTKRTTEIGQKAKKAKLIQSMNDEPVLIVRRDKFRKPLVKDPTKTVKDVQTRYINRENSVPYKHGAPIEQIFKEYREANMYSRARLTKVNKKELVSAIMSARLPNLGPAVEHIGSESEIFTRLSQERASQPDARSTEETGTRGDINKPASYPSTSQSEPYLHVCSLSLPQQRSRLTALKHLPLQVHTHFDGHAAEVPRATYELLLGEENKLREARTKCLQLNKRQEDELAKSMRKILKDDVERAVHQNFTTSDIKTRAKPIRAEKAKTGFNMQPTVVQLRNDVQQLDRNNYLESSFPQQWNEERHTTIKKEVNSSSVTSQVVGIEKINRGAEKWKTVFGKKEEPKYRITLDFDGPKHQANAQQQHGLESSTVEGLTQRKTTRNTKKGPKGKDTNMGNLFLSGVHIETVKKETKSNKEHEKKKRISPNILGFKITNSTIQSNSTKMDDMSEVISSFGPSKEELLLPLHESETKQTYEVTQLLSPQFGPDDRPQSDNEVIIRGYLGFMDDPRKDFDIVIDPETFEGLNHHKKDEISKMSQGNGEPNSEKRFFDDALTDVNKSQSLPVTRVPEELHLHELFAKTEALKSKLQSDPIMSAVGDHFGKDNATEAQRHIATAINNKDLNKTEKKSGKITSNVRQNMSRAERDTCPNPEEVTTLLNRLNIDTNDCLAANQSIVHNPNRSKKTGEFYRRVLNSSYLQKYEGASLKQLKLGLEGAGQGVASNESQDPNSPAGGDAPWDVSSKSPTVSWGTYAYGQLSADLSFDYNGTEGTSSNNQCDNPFLDTKHPLQTSSMPDSQLVRPNKSLSSNTCTKNVRFVEPANEELNHGGFGVKNSKATTNLSDKSETKLNFTSRTELESYLVHSSPRNKHTKHVTATTRDIGEIDKRIFPSNSKSEPYSTLTVRFNPKKSNPKLDVIPNKALAESIVVNAMRSGTISSATNSYIDKVYNTLSSKSFDSSEESTRHNKPTVAEVPETLQTTGKSHSLQYSELTKSYSDLLSKLKQVNHINNQYKAKKRR